MFGYDFAIPSSSRRLKMATPETPTTTDPEDLPRSDAKADVGLVAALGMEVAPFVGRCLPVQHYKGDRFQIRGLLLHDLRLAVVESGPGANLAARATQVLLDGHQPDWILSVGFSGALQPHLKVGDLVVADAIVDREGKGLKVDVRMQSAPKEGLYVGKFANVDQIVRTIADKQSLAEATGAIAVDMESLAVARVCGERGIKFMAVRVISDDMSKDLPAEILSVFGNTGFLRAGAVLRALWNRPSSWSDMWQLREQSVQAAARLGLFLKNVVEKIGGY